MKTKIKVKVLNPFCCPEINEKGDWIDLKSAINVDLDPPVVDTLKQSKNRKSNFSTCLIPLGVAMQLPKGYEAVALPRSSSFKKFGIILANSEGVIDNCYNGDDDEWKFNAIAITNAHIEEGDRICQFRIQLSQKATMWQKIKWLFSSGIELKYVNSLNNESRGGFGSTGVK